MKQHTGEDRIDNRDLCEDCPTDCDDMWCMQESIEEMRNTICLLREELGNTKRKLTDTQINLAKMATKLAIAGLL